MVDSILILCDRGPFGTNSANEAIRLGAGIMGLGAGVSCKLLLMGDAVLFASKNLDAKIIGMDSSAEAMELAELTELPLLLVEEDMQVRGLGSADLIAYPNLTIIKKQEIPEILQQFSTAFRV